MPEPDDRRATPSLSGGDVERLLKEPSAHNRGEIVTKIAGDFTAAALTERERAIATQIFRLLVTDAEVLVRQALAEGLRDEPLLPHDIALELARDLVAVATPILESSKVLTDDDLIEIIHNPVGAKLVSVAHDPDLMTLTHDHADASAKQIAIARRPEVSAPVSSALVEHGNEAVAVTLIGNAGAEISNRIAQRMVDRFGGDKDVQTALVDRSELPVGVMERLVHLVSDALRARIVARGDMAEDLAHRLAMLAQEKATMALLSPGSTDDQISKLVRQLRESDRLTPTIILRALCIGERRFFEMALARRANLAVQTACDLLNSGSEARLYQVFRSAGLQDRLYKPFRTAVETAAQIDADTAPQSRTEYAQTMINGILNRYDSDQAERNWYSLAANELEYVLARIAPGN
ncbi:MAG: DUF2336 domain-containing protein [Alphaproteobacteria bacterium]|jgi:uncharacterized protein (DUF2336 family)|nr:DUF2336 domain-containing protein [Alphaproteobacteria bacterium]MDP6517401.1 DUF2336 domain-containing protein [Alphaproteobacteria bacterium]